MTIRAIIADDEPYLARFLSDELKKSWPELEIVATLGNGIDAAKSIDALEPDVAFLDIQMPGMTGLKWRRASKEKRYACLLRPMTNLRYELLTTVPWIIY